LPTRRPVTAEKAARPVKVEKPRTAKPVQPTA